jgi:hypothetical protein
MGEPPPGETVLVGSVGLSLFLLLFLFAIVSYGQSSKSLSQCLFLSLSFMSLLELPRYLLMIIYRDYNSTWAYSCHILANYFFFLCLTFVLFMWGFLLELDHYLSTILYSKSGLIITNILLALTAVIEIFYCLFFSSSLSSYFESIVYEIYVLIECGSVILYIGIMTVYGVRLVLRFRQYIHRLDINETMVPSLEFFHHAIVRVTVMLTAITFCALLRLSLLLFKITLQHSNIAIHSVLLLPSFPPPLPSLPRCWLMFLSSEILRSVRLSLVSLE